MRLLTGIIAEFRLAGKMCAYEIRLDPLRISSLNQD